MSDSGGLKKFVTETEAEDVRKKRQEEWEQIRKPDEPLERPEVDEVPDNRTLYEKLQEQKDKKQEEWDEQHKLKNLFRGLDGEEVEFLDLVSKQQQQVNKQRFDEENREVKDFKSAVSDLDSTASLDLEPANPAIKQITKKKSQADLIAGAIKRKSSTSSSQSSQEKKAKPDNETQDRERPADPSPTTRPADNSDKDGPRKVLVPRCRVTRTGINMRQTLTIPGMGIYSDSSDSESSSSDSDIGTSTTSIRH